MKTTQIKSYIEKLNNSEFLLEKILNEIPIGVLEDLVRTKVFGIISKEEKNCILSNLKASNSSENYNLDTYKNQLLSIIKLSSSIPGKDVNKKTPKYILPYIEREMKVPGLAVEYFLLDQLLRYDSDNQMGYKKAPAEFDEMKIDILSNGYGIQVYSPTNTTKNYLDKKYQDMQQLRDIINYPDSDLYNENMYSSKLIPHTGILLTLNQEFSNDMYLDKKTIQKNRQNKKNNKTKKNTKNSLEEAYEKWKKTGYTEGGPVQYLEGKLKNQLEIIAISFPHMIQAFEKINQSNKPYSSKHKKINLGKEIGIITITSDFNNKCITFDLINHKISASPIYSCIFYPTKVSKKKLKSK